MLGWEAVADREWSRMFHAYGPATDTPEHLRRLTGDDPSLQEKAIDHLMWSVTHQYTCFPATSSAIRVVGGMLDHPSLRREASWTHGSVLAVVLDFLDEAAYGAARSADDGAPVESTLTWADMDVTARAVSAICDNLLEGPDSLAEATFDRLLEWASADLFAVLAELVEVILPYVDDEDPAVAIRAVSVLTRLGRTPGVAHRRAELVDLFSERMATASGRDCTAALVVGVGEMDGTTKPWLDHQDPALKACSAVYLPDDAQATETLLTALRNPIAVRAWFGRSPWHFQGVLEPLISSLLGRDLTFAEVLPAAVAVAESGSPILPELDWALFLRRAFPDVPYEPGVQPPPPTVLDDAQRAFLLALLRNSAIWGSSGSVDLALMRAGIPTTQSGVRALVRATSPSR